jgi:hypothetical protein
MLWVNAGMPQPGDRLSLIQMLMLKRNSRCLAGLFNSCLCLRVPTLRMLCRFASLFPIGADAVHAADAVQACLPNADAVQMQHPLRMLCRLARMLCRLPIACLPPLGFGFLEETLKVWGLG